MESMSARSRCWRPSRLQLGRAALVDVTTVAVAAVSVPLLIYSRVNSAWLIFAAGMAGLDRNAMVRLSAPNDLRCAP